MSLLVIINVGLQRIQLPAWIKDNYKVIKDKSTITSIAGKLLITLTISPTIYSIF